MKRKLLLFFALMAIGLSHAWAYDFSAVAPTGQTLYYNFNGSSLTVSVTYPGSGVESRSYVGFTKPSGSLQIPSNVIYGGQIYSVTAIGHYAFYNCSGLANVTIPNTVTTIGNSAFELCTSISGATIPNSVIAIGENAFCNCSSLTEIIIPNRLAFIEMGTFSGCTNLTGVTIPNSVTNIGSFAFYDCRRLTSISIESEVAPSIDPTNFYTFFNVPTNIPVYVPCGMVSAYQAANGWNRFTNIQEDPSCYPHYDLYYTFEGSSATVYGSAGFNNDRVAIANNGTFEELEIPSSVTYNGNTYSVTHIGDYAFSNCLDLTSVTIPNSVSIIGVSAFENCSGLTSVTIHNGVRTIDFSAFMGCSSLTNVTIPNSVTSIGTWAFYHCSSLTGVTIPNSVTSIGLSAFALCSGLTNIIVAPNNNTYDSRDNCNAIIETSTNTLIAACSNTTIPNSVTGIGNAAFAGCNGLTNMTIPNSITAIGNEAFAYCSGLTSVTIPNSVASIGSGAFEECRSLTSVTIPNSVTSIGSNTFDNCRNLTSVIIPNMVTSIGDYAFYSCRNLTSIIIPKSVRSIGSRAFENCTRLKTIYNLSRLTLTIGNTNYGYVAKYAKRIITSIQTSGNGVNTIYKIPDTYTIVQAETDQVDNNIPESSLPTNFIAKNNGNWFSKNIVLIDCQDEFHSPVSFTAEHASYTRDFTEGNRSTLYLPFSAPVPADFEVYEFSDFNMSTKTLSFSPLADDAEIAAYTPYLVGYGLTKSGNTTFSAEQAAFPATDQASPAYLTTHNNMEFHGTVVRTPDLDINNFGYKDGFFVRSGGSAHVNPFRCYFTLSGSQSAPATLSVDTDGDYLGIEDVDSDMEQTSIRYSNDVYDMMGRLVRKDADNLRGLPRGIYIWRGKKLIAY